MDVLEQALGAIFITIGLWLIYPPCAIIAFGLMIALHGVLYEFARIRNEEVTDGDREAAQVDDTAGHT